MPISYNGAKYPATIIFAITINKPIIIANVRPIAVIVCPGDVFIQHFADLLYHGV